MMAERERGLHLVQLLVHRGEAVCALQYLLHFEARVDKDAAAGRGVREECGGLRGEGCVRAVDCGLMGAGCGSRVEGCGVRVEGCGVRVEGCGLRVEG